MKLLGKQLIYIFHHFDRLYILDPELINTFKPLYAERQDKEFFCTEIVMLDAAIVRNLVDYATGYSRLLRTSMVSIAWPPVRITH